MRCLPGLCKSTLQRIRRLNLWMLQLSSFLYKFDFIIIFKCINLYSQFQVTKQTKCKFSGKNPTLLVQRTFCVNKQSILQKRKSKAAQDKKSFPHVSNSDPQFLLLRLHQGPQGFPFRWENCWIKFDLAHLFLFCLPPLEFDDRLVWGRQMVKFSQMCLRLGGFSKFDSDLEDLYLTWRIPMNDGGALLWLALILPRNRTCEEIVNNEHHSKTFKWDACLWHFFASFPTRAFFGALVHWWPRNPSLWMIKWSQWSPRRTGRGWRGSLRKERPT